jgi:hypothetical protein
MYAQIADVNSCVRTYSTTDDVVEGVNWAVADFKARAHAKAGIINISWQVYNTDKAEAAFKAVRRINIRLLSRGH